MKAQRFLKISLLLLTFLASCTDKQNKSDDNIRTLKIEKLSEDIMISSKAWEMLEFKDRTVPSGLTPVMSEISVILTEKNKGVLKSRKLRVVLPRGGGEVDLAEYIGAVPGTYFVNFEYPPFKDSKERRVLFQSSLPTATLDRKSYGAGCGTLSDISSKMLVLMQDDGIKVNTTGDRDLYVIGGTFLFASQVGSEILVSQVTFKDSQRKQLFCGGQ